MTNSDRNPPVIIAGGGLSGLCVAHSLSVHNIPYMLLEARDRLGGRILSTQVDTEKSHAHAAGAVDLGPSWFWPGQQNMLGLIKELELESHVYEQYSDGLSVIEYGNNQLERRMGGASMAGSLRIDGGMARLISALQDRLASEFVRPGTSIEAITQTDSGVEVGVVHQNQPAAVISARCVVLAVPPRVADSIIKFDPELPSQNQQLLSSMPTWMAGHAKFVAVYDSPFWRQQGLSGDAMSQIGPCVEIHDASPRGERSFALFGFVGIAANDRIGREDHLKQLAVEQLVRLFGTKAAQPISVHYKDWAADPLTATPHDLAPPISQRSAIPASEWQGRIVWAGTETAGLSGHSNGYLEGAVEAGNRAAREVIRQLR